MIGQYAYPLFTARPGKLCAMKKELIVQLHASFEEMVHVEEEAGVEFWLARDLQEVPGVRHLATY